MYVSSNKSKEIPKSSSGNSNEYDKESNQPDYEDKDPLEEEQ